VVQTYNYTSFMAVQLA